MNALQIFLVNLTSFTFIISSWTQISLQYVKCHRTIEGRVNLPFFDFASCLQRYVRIDLSRVGSTDARVEEQQDDPSLREDLKI